MLVSSRVFINRSQTPQTAFVPLGIGARNWPRLQ